MPHIYPTQDPKYSICVDDTGAYLVNAATGKPIPKDMPVFMFLGKDRKAVSGALQPYLDVCENAGQIRAVHDRIVQFQEYARTHPGSMKEPDTARPATDSQ